MNSLKGAHSMSYPKIDNIDAAKEFGELLNNSFNPKLDTNLDKELREKIYIKFTEISQKTNLKTYAFDLELAKYLYELFNGYEWFNSLVESDYDFWKYIAIRIIPDLINLRHGENPEYYYKKNVRIYPSTLYWYYHLSFNKSVDETYKMLSNEIFSTDTIMQIVERPGREGVEIEVIRGIIRKYSTLDTKRFINEDGVSFDKLRAVMILNTAKSITIVPSLSSGGIEGYVNMLFNEAIREVQE